MDKSKVRGLTYQAIGVFKALAQGWIGTEGVCIG